MIAASARFLSYGAAWSNSTLGYDVTLPEALEQYGDQAVLAALVCFEKIGTLDFAGREAELVEQLVRSALVRATVVSRFILSDGEIRIRMQSHGLTVAGAWMKRVLSDSKDRST